MERKRPYNIVSEHTHTPKRTKNMLLFKVRQAMWLEPYHLKLFSLSFSWNIFHQSHVKYHSHKLLSDVYEGKAKKSINFLFNRVIRMHRKWPLQGYKGPAEITTTRETKIAAGAGQKEAQKKEKIWPKWRAWKQLVDRKFIKYNNLKRIDKVYCVWLWTCVCVCVH